MDGPDQGPPPPGTPPPPPPPPGAMPPPRPVVPAPSSGVDFTVAFRFGWEVFKQAPGPLAGAVAITYAAVFVVMGIGVGVVLLLTRGLGSGSAAGVAVGVVVGLFGFVAFVAVAQLPTVVLLRAGKDAVEGRPISLGRMFRAAGFGRLLGAMLLVMLGVLVGYVLLVVPGIVFGVMAAFTLHHMIEDERLTAVEGIRASIATFRAEPWPSIGVVLVTGLAAGLGTYLCFVGIVISAPVAIIAQVHGFRQVTDRPVPVPPAP